VSQLSTARRQRVDNTWQLQRKARYALATKLNSTRSNLVNRQQIGLFGNNLNESHDDPVTSQ